MEDGEQDPEVSGWESGKDMTERLAWKEVKRGVNEHLYSRDME